MKALALLAVVASAAYYYYLQHPEVVLKLRPQTASSKRTAPAAAPKQQLHYHSPLDASNSRSSSGYYSADAPEHYEVTGQRATASGRAALLNPPAEAPRDAGEDQP